MLLIVNVAVGVLEGLLVVVEVEVESEVEAEVDSDVGAIWVGLGTELEGLAIVKLGEGTTSAGDDQEPTCCLMPGWMLAGS